MQRGCAGGLLRVRRVVRRLAQRRRGCAARPGARALAPVRCGQGGPGEFDRRTLTGGTAGWDFDRRRRSSQTSGLLSPAAAAATGPASGQLPAAAAAPAAGNPATAAAAAGTGAAADGGGGSGARGNGGGGSVGPGALAHSVSGLSSGGDSEVRAMAVWRRFVST
jgi:hypothetical protein